MSLHDYPLSSRKTGREKISSQLKEVHDFKLKIVAVIRDQLANTRTFFDEKI